MVSVNLARVLIATRINICIFARRVRAIVIFINVRGKTNDVFLIMVAIIILFTVIYQKRLKKERRARKRLQEQLDLEIKRRTQLEEALKATGASSEQVRAITGKYEQAYTEKNFEIKCIIRVLYESLRIEEMPVPLQKNIIFAR